jgi:hypothetical protein
MIMSVKWINRTWNDAQVSGRPLILLLALATRANAEGQVQITAHDLRHQTRLNEMQFRGALEQLEVTKHLEIKGPDVHEGRLHIILLPGKSWALTRAF